MQLTGTIKKSRAFLENKNVFLYLYYLSIAAVLVGFLYSRALLSIGQISMVITWFLEGNLTIKLKKLWDNKMAWLFSGFYLVHVIWLINTSDFEYAAEDLRIKLPLLLFPIILSTTEFITPKTVRLIFFGFITVILSSTLVITIHYFLKRAEISDIRQASFLISHIRLALMICLSIAASIYYSVRESIWLKIILITVSLWLTVYMIYFVYLTGIFILALLLLFMLTQYLIRSRLQKKTKSGVYIVLISIFLMLGFSVYEAYSDYFTSNSYKEIPDLIKTQGNRNYSQWYKPDEYSIRENGYLVFQNLNFEEIQAEWNRRSEIKVTFFDDEHSELEDIILRFLTSKGLPKDSMAVASLSDEEIHAIEQGLTNVNFIGKSTLYKRVYVMLWEYDIYMSGGNFNGHSLGGRLEFWKTGINIFKRKPFFGTGTGDIEWTFQEQYELDNSALNKEWRFRSHNQIISVAATFGILGLMYFLVMLILPIFMIKNNFLYLCFSLIFFISILTEDTLETQIGVTFYAFFNSLLFFIRPSKNEHQESP